MPMPPALSEMPALDFYVLQGEVHLQGDKEGGMLMNCCMAGNMLKVIRR